MSDHSRLSPSRAHRYMACPGSVREEDKYPEEHSNAASDGTHTHYILECCVQGGLADPTQVCVGRKYKDHTGEFVCDEERAKRVKVAIDYIKSRGEELLNAEVISEERVSLISLMNRDDMDGTCDIQIHAQGVLEIIDYKDGMVFVSPEDNPQLELYALGALSMIKRNEGEDYPFHKVRLTIVQPKLEIMGMKPIQWVELEIDALLDKVDEYIAGAARTDLPDAELNPGEKQCRYCRARGSCTALSTSVLENMGITAPFQPAVDVASELANSDPNTMSNEQVRKIIEAAPLMRQLLDAVEEEALKRFKSGVSIEGLKAVNGRGSQVWTFNEDETADKLKKMGIPVGEIYETKLISPAKAKKATWVKRNRGEETKMQLSARQLKTLEAEYITKVAGKLTIVSESDSRPAIVLDAAPLFSAVQEAPKEPSLPAWLS